jgi:hypothetical protein
VQAAVDVADALGAQPLVEGWVAAVDRAGPSIGAARPAPFAVGLEAAVEPVEVFGGELLEADPADAGGDVALDGLAVVGPADRLDRQSFEPGPQVVGQPLTALGGIAAEPLFVTGERVARNRLATFTVAKPRLVVRRRSPSGPGGRS